MLSPNSIKSLSMLLLAGGALSAFNAARADEVVAMASTSALPSCASANFDSTRELFTIINGAPRVARGTGEPLDAKGRVMLAKEIPVNQQCVLHVTGAANPRAGEIAAGTYTVYYSGGGDGGAGGSARSNGGGGGGASAVQERDVVRLAPGDYVLTLGMGGPGGVACKGALGGGPGYPGAPTNLVALSSGAVVAGDEGAARYQRPSRRELEKMLGNKDGHGGSGPGKAPGGNGGFNTPARAFGATEGSPNPAPWVASVPGDNGSGEIPRVAEGVSAGGGGGAGLGNGGAGAGLNTSAPTRPVNYIPEMGGLGAGGGGGRGDESSCTAGAQGGPGYMAFRRG